MDLLLCVPDGPARLLERRVLIGLLCLDRTHQQDSRGPGGRTAFPEAALLRCAVQR
jgi:hypothetical protein